jgi:hypothetical protein
VTARYNSTAAVTCALARVGAGGQGGDQSEFGDSETAGSNGQHRQQPDEREGRQGGLPGHVGIALVSVTGVLPVAGLLSAQADCGS